MHADALLAPRGMTQQAGMWQWRDWESPLPSRFIFRLLGERVPDSLLGPQWCAAANARVADGPRLVKWVEVAREVRGHKHAELRTAGALRTKLLAVGDAKREQLARERLGRERREEQQRRRAAEAVDEKKAFYLRLQVRSLPRRATPRHSLSLTAGSAFCASPYCAGARRLGVLRRERRGVGLGGDRARQLEARRPRAARVGDAADGRQGRCVC